MSIGNERFSGSHRRSDLVEPLNVLGMWWGWSNFFGSLFYRKLNIENKNEDSVG